MKLVKELEIVILHQEFKEGCYVDVKIKLRLAKAFQEKLYLLNALGVKVTRS